MAEVKSIWLDLCLAWRQCFFNFNELIVFFKPCESWVAQECEKVLPMQSLNFSFYKQHGFFVLVFVVVPPPLSSL